MQPDLQKLADTIEIQQVVARFARGIDRMDAELVRSCYHDGALDHHGTFFDGDADGFVAWTKAHLPLYAMTMHFLGQTLVEFPEPAANVAGAETYVIGFHQMAEGGEDAHWTSGFRYLDRFEKRLVDGKPEWRIAERTVVGEWRRIGDPLQFPRPAADERQARKRDQSDPVYRLLPGRGRRA